MQKNSQGGVLYLCYILTKTHSHGTRLHVLYISFKSRNLMQAITPTLFEII